MQKFYLRTEILYPLKYKHDKMLASKQAAVNISFRHANRQVLCEHISSALEAAHEQNGLETKPCHCSRNFQS